HGARESLTESFSCSPSFSFLESVAGLVVLPQNWTDTKETLLEGMVFNVKYLGMTLVGQPKGEDMASAAIRRIVTTARASAKKFRKVTLTVSPKGIVITDTETADLVENVSIYRISYCTADKTQDKVFAYVSQSQFNETLECHAFLCQKKKIAQAVTLTVAQAFKVALDLWEIAQEGKARRHQDTFFYMLYSLWAVLGSYRKEKENLFIPREIINVTPRRACIDLCSIQGASWDLIDG
uniref:Si:dkey-71h2.2 n=1 Tax=Salarias fasciatus TaxID=181472 RepID=A0A672FZR8_SALFA